MLRNRPIGLVLVAAALIVLGLQAMVEAVVAWNDGRITLNSAFLLVPAGIGLLRLSDGWRKFSLYSLGLGAVWLVALLVYEIARPGQSAVTWFGTRPEGAFRYAFFGAVIAIGSLVIGFAFHTLTRPEIKRLFRSDPEADSLLRH